MFCVYFYVMTPYLMLLIDSPWTQSQQHYHSYSNEAYLTHIYSPAGTLQPTCPYKQHFVCVLGVHFKCGITTKSTKCKRCDTKYTTERTLKHIYSMRADTKGEASLCSASTGDMLFPWLKFVLLFTCSWMATKHCESWVLGATDKF